MKPGPRRPKTEMLGTKRGWGVLCLPPEERPMTKRTRQSWGLSIVMESTREAQKLSPVHSGCLLDLLSKLKLQCQIWLHPFPLQPHP